MYEERQVNLRQHNKLVLRYFKSFMASKKYTLWQRRKKRVRGKISGTAQRPRLSVYRSLTSFSAQLIDDVAGVTLASATEKISNIEGAKKVAVSLAAKYTGPCVFDRNGYQYHGRVKAFADVARENGLQF